MTTPSATPRDNAAIPSAYRVLIVDDLESVREAIAGLLKTRGYESVTAASGAAALARLKAEYFDVMICDVRMPGMSGLELLSEALLLDRDLPVLMLTGVNDVATARDALARGAMDYLKKPIELDELDHAVRAAAHHRRNMARRTPAAGTPAVAMASVELRGGPLAERWVPVAESRFRLWVVMQSDGEHVWAAMDEPAGLPAGSVLTGFYSYSRDAKAMLWESRSK
jgi:FixJ family two-component response regulator